MKSKLIRIVTSAVVVPTQFVGKGLTTTGQKLQQAGHWCANKAESVNASGTALADRLQLEAEQAASHKRVTALKQSLDKERELQSMLSEACGAVQFEQPVPALVAAM